MQIIEHFVKESAEWVIRGARRQALGVVPKDLFRTINQIHKYGYVVIEEFWPSDRCSEAVEAINRELCSPTKCHRWDDAEGSDHRLYYAERMGGLLGQFHGDKLIESCRQTYSGVKRAEKLLLAARLDCTASNLGSGGGWHRDSPHRSQFKAILYLSDVYLENGPFEYLEYSHLVSQSLRMVANGLSRPNQYRFSDHEIESIVSSGEVIPRTFVGKAGTLLLVDTKGIHRGQPIRLGTRHALTEYCFDEKIPNGFLP
jgi:hypothetical protein